jgi:aldose 1-epimerase
MIPPSGEQYPISWGDQRATIVEVGGGIRQYAVGGRPVLEPYPVESMCDGAHGTPLIPWPNRLADGRYHFDGHDYQVALTEPDKHNAIHGLLRWHPWSAVERADHRVVMATRLYPLTGWPFLLDLRLTYELGDGGLVVRTTATNLGDGPCPYACGQHPYLSPGEGLVDDAVLQLDAAVRVTTDDERQLPTGTEPVDGTAFDFRAGRRIGDQAIDYPFTDLARDGDGRAWARLRGPDGRQAELWVDEHYPIVEIFTGDTLAPHRRRRGLGTEPMTCPPNGLATGTGVIRLESGETVETAWGARLA